MAAVVIAEAVIVTVVEARVDFPKSTTKPS
jgi:hypothetical protein